jgi:hypothetical protein
MYIDDEVYEFLVGSDRNDEDDSDDNDDSAEEHLFRTSVRRDLPCFLKRDKPIIVPVCVMEVVSIKQPG